jgi:hypothetical protein
MSILEMKVINPEILEVHHPRDWDVDQTHIGKSKNRIVKIRNFFKNPDAVRAFALSCDYVSTLNGEYTNLPGFVHRIGHISKQFHEPFKFACHTYFEAGRSVMSIPAYSDFTFQMYEVNEKCRMCSLAPHTDDTHYAGVLCLNKSEELVDTDSGTAFFRNVELNEEFVSSDKNYRSSRSLNHTNAFVNFDPSKFKSKEWERYHVELHEYNSLILYEGRLWHSPFFRQGEWSTNRLTFNAFLQ